VKYNEVTLGHYQEVARSTAIYPNAGDGTNEGMMYAALGLAGEAGELANKVKKLHRDGYARGFYEEAAAELGDALWYIAAMATELGYNLDDIAQHNMAKLKDRAARGKLGGSGDDR
jgi:NTP pyrophosphatase (non-canonical NTP hydrolase)